jgi:hypothetical protein
MLNSPSTLGNLVCVEMIVGVEWCEPAATFWYQNLILTSQTDANKCIQNNKTGIQSLRENREKQMDTKYEKGYPISASKKTDANTKQESNLCKQTDATQIVQVMFPSQMLFQVLHTQL